jgi:hypothetical protein
MWWRSTEVEAPAERVWDLLVDLDRWPAWGPTVRSATLDDGTRRLAADATGRVRPTVGPALSFAVTRWVPGEEWAWRVAGIPATTHRVEPLGPDRSRVALGAPVWAAAYLPVLELAVRRIAGLVPSLG